LPTTPYWQLRAVIGRLLLVAGTYIISATTINIPMAPRNKRKK
jgi:hypothetical protein